MSSRSKLYLLLMAGCLIGYCWIYLHMSGVAGHSHSSLEVCLIKNVTGKPCPSCGSTRAAASLVNGDIQGAFLLNPIGPILFLFSIILPFWIVLDLIFRKSSLYDFYQSGEKILRQKKYMILFFLLILANWAWNIYKGL